MQLIIGAVILALVAGLGATIVHTYSRAITRAETAESDLKTSKANEITLIEANADQRVENARLTEKQRQFDEILTARKSSDAKIAALGRKIDEKLSAVVASSPTAKAWWNTPVPSDVLNIVREQAGSSTAGADGQGNAGTVAGSMDGRNAGSGLAGSDDKRAAFRLRPVAPIARPNVQR